MEYTLRKNKGLSRLKMADQALTSTGKTQDLDPG